MDIWNYNKLIVFILFVVPGFICIKIYDITYSGAPRETDKRLIDIVVYSSVNYAILFYPIYVIEKFELIKYNEYLYFLSYIFSVIISPTILSLLLMRVRRVEFIQRMLPHPMMKPWDYVFSKREPFWVIVMMKDGRRIGGRYDANSFASSSPSLEQIYIEECWHINEDGGFERKKEDTRGVIVLSSEIISIELYEICEET